MLCLQIKKHYWQINLQNERVLLWWCYFLKTTVYNSLPFFVTVLTLKSSYSGYRQKIFFCKKLYTDFSGISITHNAPGVFQMWMASSSCAWSRPSVMCCLFKSVGGQEWRCYQAAIYHTHDTLSPPHPHLQAMLYRRTNTSPPAARSSIFQRRALRLHEYPHAGPVACCGKMWENATGLVRWDLHLKIQNYHSSLELNIENFSRRRTINSLQCLENSTYIHTSSDTHPSKF